MAVRARDDVLGRIDRAAEPAQQELRLGDGKREAEPAAFGHRIRGLVGHAPLDIHVGLVAGEA